jgi:positive regulator of sigma E activity
MYLIPLIFLVVVALIAAFWAPIFAVIIFVIGFIVFLAVVSLKRRPDQLIETNRDPVAASTPTNPERDGIWGEKDPDSDS